ncbi:winged helix-turn-helix domain-containing protein [Caenimonas sp. SL110]|uniref:winged helix-turn-helix domain-containing protein n=1 Tax=Caenimonas sp. SL110 TaxID=1450524 RepID=UPI00069F574E|nr:winged helix-turn-helix domain-containing protein [Caenimonas sp. SL110]
MPSPQLGQERYRCLHAASEIVFDMAQGAVFARGERVALTRSELVVLRVLVEHAGDTVRRETLEQRLYRWGQELSSNAIDVHIHALRRKLKPEIIETRRGVGFRLNPDGWPQANAMIG